MQRVRSMVAVLAAAFIGIAAVTDNAAVCPSKGEAGSQHERGGGPAHVCAQSPCQTPTVVRPACAMAPPPPQLSTVGAAPLLRPSSADRPAPPTPPPTLLA